MSDFTVCIRGGSMDNSSDTIICACVSFPQPLSDEQLERLLDICEDALLDVPDIYSNDVFQKAIDESLEKFETETGLRGSNSLEGIDAFLEIGPDSSQYSLYAETSCSGKRTHWDFLNFVDLINKWEKLSEDEQMAEVRLIIQDEICIYSSLGRPGYPVTIGEALRWFKA